MQPAPGHPPPIIAAAPTRGARARAGHVVTTSSAIELVAHRGNALDYPENTLEAFGNGLRLGADRLELDVHATSDGTVVVRATMVDQIRPASAPTLAALVREVMENAATLAVPLVVGYGIDDHVFLDATHLGEHFATRFPSITEACRKNGVDPCMQRIPVAPAAHYACGGIRADLDGRTNVAGLYAVGEVACTGLHGANRLASNSVTEGLVAGTRLGRELAWRLPERVEGAFELDL